MRFPCISEVQAYWEALRDGRQVPCRSEVDPRGIERALEYTFVLERIAPGVARFRLAGMHLNSLMGMEVRGMPLTAFFTPKARAEVASILDRVFSAPSTAEMTLTAETGLGRPPMEARLLILPLKSDLGDISRALGCLMAEGALGRAPRRFEIGARSITPIAPGLPSPSRGTVAATGFAEPTLPFRDAAPEPGRSHLRLIVTDK
ncbi:PAS domain-containing protein [Defluviimonas sp. WL0024]|uniref:PAS domain-containing protein n=2 Tax=Albidovulum TaxID=205889 RepID=A0ABT3J062_9RHOB|nr:MULTISPECIES: PAS domain-containing protein [Defluviimonas]MCU9846822.1 PAS domain-containing protein [Defluviimonas sp. WL0024]MCW3781081.1 PAS domain-containing protein [Defluviimonas salinarum]